MFLDPVGLPEDEWFEILEQDTADLEKLFDGAWIAQTQVPLEEHAVET